MYKNRAGETPFCLSYLPSVIFRQELNKSLQQVPESSWKWFSMKVHMKPVARYHHFLFTDYAQAFLTCDPLMLAAHLFSVCYSTGLSSIIIVASTLHAQHTHAHSTWPLLGLVLSFTAASSVFSWWEIPSAAGKGLRHCLWILWVQLGSPSRQDQRSTVGVQQQHLQSKAVLWPEDLVFLVVSRCRNPVILPEWRIIVSSKNWDWCVCIVKSLADLGPGLANACSCAYCYVDAYSHWVLQVTYKNVFLSLRDCNAQSQLFLRFWIFTMRQIQQVLI